MPITVCIRKKKVLVFSVSGIHPGWCVLYISTNDAIILPPERLYMFLHMLGYSFHLINSVNEFCGSKIKSETIYPEAKRFCYG